MNINFGKQSVMVIKIYFSRTKGANTGHRGMMGKGGWREGRRGKRGCEKDDGEKDEG